ncbi:hypothetical protein AB0F15_34315 [Amycolatopsis sp. NPDC026612]|uniref:hypothetical protein n=1 Tax=Amycolatopsis sp. NPDC026612 TaxID=3155466 RepID=UPI0033EA3140
MPEKNSAESTVARHLSAVPMQLGPLEFVTGEAPTSCCFNLLRAARAADEATLYAKAANLADQAYRIHFGHGQFAAGKAIGVAPLGNLSAGQLLAVMSSV